MIQLEYKKSNTAWPVSATSGSTEFVFSGSFRQSRITEERITKTLNKVLEVALWLLVAAGIAAAYFSIQNAIAAKTFWVFLAQNPYNQIFWVCFFTTLYLWAKRRQARIDQQMLSVLDLEKTIEQENGQATVDLYKLFSPEAKQCWNNAFSIAKKRKSKHVWASDVFLSLLEDSRVQQVCYRLSVNPNDVRTLLSNYLTLKQDNAPLNTIPFTAFQESVKLHNPSIDPLMLLCALVTELPEDHIIQNIFFNLNVDREKIETIASWLFHMRLLSDEYKLFRKLAKYKPDNETDKGMTAVPTFYLDRFSQDLTRLAKHGRLPLALGRADDLSQLFKLFASGRQNIIIKGPIGSGRTTVIQELSYKMAAEQVPGTLSDKRLVKLELSALLSSKIAAEGALINALSEAVSSGNIVLVIEDIHQLARARSSQGLSLLEVLLNFLENNPLIVIATTTTEDYSDYLRSTPNFDEVFMSYELMSFTRANILLAACSKASLLEGENKCFFLFGAIEQAVELTDLYIKDVSQPQKAVSILVEAATRAKNAPKKERVITAEIIQKIVSE
jgi:ATP-dependent Clp protease ATP-binding subunit ClpA